MRSENALERKHQKFTAQNQQKALESEITKKQFARGEA